MRNKKITLEEYCKIKVDIEYVFFFFLNPKQNTHFKHPKSITTFTKLTSLQRPT